MNLKVQIILVLVFYKKVSTNSNQFPKVPTPLSLHEYEGNFYPAYASSLRTIHPRNVPLQGVDTSNSKPTQFTVRYLNPVHLSHQVYHDEAATNTNAHQTPRSNIDNNDDDDATGSGYQVAMKVQPLLAQQVTSSGKPRDIIEESGKSQSKRRLKIDGIMSPENEKRMQPLRNNNQNGFYRQKINGLHLPSSVASIKSVPNKINTGVSRHYHDIFLNYKSPEELVFGHVLSWPELAQKRLEKRDNNHFKGQVIWADKTGGYGEHYWDLAQGAL